MIRSPDDSMTQPVSPCLRCEGSVTPRLRNRLSTPSRIMAPAHDPASSALDCLSRGDYARHARVPRRDALPARHHKLFSTSLALPEEAFPGARETQLPSTYLVHSEPCSMLAFRCSERRCEWHSTNATRDRR